MMRSQFDSPLKVDNEGQVSAQGTLEWGPEEEKAVVEVTILQEMGPGELAKVGTGKAVFMKSGDPQAWSLPVSSGPGKNQLTPGKKRLASGIACGLGKNIEMRQFIWSQEIELIP